MKKALRTIHRVTAYVVGIQVLLWIAGGLTFAWLPFDSIVKGGAVAAPPERQALPAGALAVVVSQLENTDDLAAISTHPSAQGALLYLETQDGKRWLRLRDGLPASTPGPQEVSAFARDIYRGDGRLTQTRYLQGTESRALGLVDEMYGRADVWQVAFDDRYGTRLYFDGPTGRYLTVRNDFWVLYDAMWRLHIMDYADGEDFNNPLLTAFATVAALFALSGAGLVVFALARLVRSRRAPV